MEILILFLLGLKNIRLNFLVARNMAKLKVVCFVAVPFGRTASRRRHLFPVL